MIAEFVIVSFASFIGWQVFRYYSFFNLNLRLAPLVSILISYLLTLLSHPSLLIAIAATGGVALLNKITEASTPEPLSLPKINWKSFKKKWPETGLPARKDPGVGHRIRSL